MADLNKQALEMWNAMKPMVDREIDQQTKGAVQRRKAKVTTAPSLSTGKMGVTEPFGDQYFIPFTTNLSTAKVGDVVWVEYMYGATNAFASMYASADTKNWTVGGVLDVVQRRCEATLSSSGWYRVLSHTGGIPDGGIIKFRIGRNQNGECHQIDLLVPYGYGFANEVSSTSTNFGITKIRLTSSPSVAVDVYYALSTSCTLRVDFTVAGTIIQSKVVAESLQSVADAPSGETVRATYEFAKNTRNGALLIEDITVGSATLAAGAATSITKSLSKTGYTPIAVAGFYGSGNGSVAVGDCFINASNVLNMYLINTGNSSKTPTMYAKVLWQKD